ncbi:sugar kinase [Paenilisteria weihenstephanensis]|uniref:sugar kinase n=1 Tax=Listeria weihenstephanensis TaxID=1006155 RepID=UPI0004AD61E3|nr:sugar kinase [Listeria weihenstephanensis]
MGKVLTLGEGMLRFSTSTGKRLSNVEAVSLHYGGGEANVAISLANYGHDTYFASKVPNNSLGEGFKNHLQNFNVNTDVLLRGGKRIGTYYVEVGAGERGAKVLYDREQSSFATMNENEWDSLQIFKDIDFFHISGITPALSSFWRKLTCELLSQAKKAGCKISFDVNYRAKLWTQEEASQMLKEILPLVDYCSLGKLDALYLLGIKPYQGGEDEIAHYYSEIQKKISQHSSFIRDKA